MYTYPHLAPYIMTSVPPALATSPCIDDDCLPSSTSTSTRATMSMSAERIEQAASQLVDLLVTDISISPKNLTPLQVGKG